MSVARRDVSDPAQGELWPDPEVQFAAPLETMLRLYREGKHIPLSLMQTLINQGVDVGAALRSIAIPYSSHK